MWIRIRADRELSWPRVRFAGCSGGPDARSGTSTTPDRDDGLVGATRARLVGGLGRDDAGLLGVPVRQPVLGVVDQGLRVVVSGGPGGAAGPGDLPAARDRPALSVHVPSLRSGDARAGESAGCDRDAGRPGAGQLG